MCNALSSTWPPPPPPTRLSPILLLLIASCARACAGPQQPPTLLHTLTCLDRPPPMLPLPVIEGGIVEPPACPVGLLCLTVPARVAWARWSVEMARWAAQTWIECGPLANAKPAPGPEA